MRDNFRPAGEVEYAAYCQQPPLFTTKPSNKPSFNASQKQGLRYERRVQDHIRELCGEYPNLVCLCNPWLMFHRVGDGSGAISFCQPDCLLVDNSRRKITIIEVKYIHTSDSWKQVRQLYEPVLRNIHSGFDFAFVEICKWFDPHKAFPETYYYCENVLEAETDRFGIHIYKPRGRG